MPRTAPTIVKRCPHCGETKSVEDFYQSEKYDGGYSPWCVDCHRVANNERWQQQRDKMRESSRRSYERNKDRLAEKNRAKSRYYADLMRETDPARYRAKKFFDALKTRAEIAPDVTREYLATLFSTVKECQCCGALLQLEFTNAEMRKVNGRLWNPRSPSIDRVNNAKGYTRNNIAVVCWNCNHRKTDLTLDDLAMLERYIRRFGDV